MSPRHRRASALLSTGIALGLALTSTTAGADVGADQPRTTSLDDTRRATARYHQVNVAIADGFVPTPECAAHPTQGGMGIHYVNPARIADPAVNAREPEILLYEPGPDGKLRLVGLEWFAVDPDQNLATDHGRPELFGVPFDGPMPGHDPDMPVHFDLHAWTWKHNPAGTFATWNPTVTCKP